MSTAENTILTPVKGYNTSKMVFSEPSIGSIPDSKPKIEFKRINISTVNEDGSIGELVLPTGRLFSFGVSENTSQETGKVNGHTFPLVLWNRDGPTEEEKEWTDKFNDIVDKCIDHILDVKDDIDCLELTKSDLTKNKGGLNPLYWKREKHINDKGKTMLRVVPNTGPTLYTKLIFSKKNNKFVSQFFNVQDKLVDPLELLGKYCHATCAIKIESIFIGNKISLQVKLYEAVIEPVTTGLKRLLRHKTERPTPQSKVLASKDNFSLNSVDEDEKDDDNDDDNDNDNDVEEDEGSIVGDNEESSIVEEEKPKKVLRKRNVRKVLKKKVAE